MLRKKLIYPAFLIWIIGVVIVVISLTLVNPKSDQVIVSDFFLLFLLCLDLATLVTAFIVCFGIVMKADGAPLTDIGEGVHNIAFMRVLPEGNKNAVQVVIQAFSDGSGLCFYTFPHSAFNGEIIPDANVLEVTVSGDKNQFKKLHLSKTDQANPSNSSEELTEA